jgi:hypothetical protein
MNPGSSIRPASSITAGAGQAVDPRVGADRDDHAIADGDRLGPRPRGVDRVHHAAAQYQIGLVHAVPPDRIRAP